MGVPKGFRKVTFDLQSPDQTEHYRVSCLVCDICQAMVLQNVPQDFAVKHKEWHKKLDDSVSEVVLAHRSLNEMYEEAVRRMGGYYVHI